MPRLARINVTPVKGTALTHPERVELTPAGIEGNRLFHLVDERGELFSGARCGPLVRVRAVFDRRTQTLTLAFPDGEVVSGAADLLGEPRETDFYGRTVPGRVVEGAFSDAFSSYVGRPLTLIRAEREGDGSDVHRLTLASLASVDELARRGGYRGALDSRRFRINLELEACAPFEEDGWEGKRVELGGATVRLHGRIPRCVVTTQSPDTGIKDWDTVKQLARFRPLMRGRRGVPFGMYAEVETPGPASIGDDVAVLDL
jgi:hypothetical protein